VSGIVKISKAGSKKRRRAEKLAVLVRVAVALEMIANEVRVLNQWLSRSPWAR